MRLPTGTVTFLFSDVEGSTRLLDAFGERYVEALTEQRRLVEAAVTDRGGVVVDTQGDSHFCVFSAAADAVLAGLAVQRALGTHAWPDGCVIRVRIGIHTGAPSLRGSEYFGIDVHQAARIMSVAHGGQVLVSATTKELLDDSFSLVDLGLHRLKDLSAPQRLFQLNGEGLLSNFPPVRSLDNRPTNLPAQSTRLVGRIRELGELSALLGRDDVRLVTLTGAGGIGKTRLALHAAAELIESFPDGVYSVSLAALQDSELIVPTISETIGVRERAGQALADTLAEFLHERRLLLVLDNFEHLLAGAPRVTRLLAHAEELHVLITSRTRLRVSGEHAYALSPLAFPATSAVSVAAAIESPAVALFVQRAQAANARFNLERQNVDSVVEICRRVDGLPLALELAAARVGALTPAGLAARLDRSLSVLTSGVRDAEERQRTLRSTIEWSYDLLQPDEQQLFARLSVFAGGWNLEGAEVVCRAAIDSFAALVDSSLVVADGDRYQMLETIREFASEKAEGEREHLCRRHANYCADILRAAMEHLDKDASASIEVEQDNIRAALRWAIDSGEGELAARLGVEIAYFWFLRNNLTEARVWLSEVMSLDCTSEALRASLLAREAAVAQGQGDYDTAAASNEVCLAIRRKLDDTSAIPAALNNLAVVYMYTDRLERATELFHECALLARSCGDELSVASAKCNLGVIAIAERDYALAEGLLREAVEIARKEEHSYGLAASLENLAAALVGSSQMREAWPVIDEALALQLALGDEVGAAGTVENAAPAIARAGRAEAAARLLGAADAVRLSNDHVPSRLEVEQSKRTQQMVRDQLSADAFALAHAEGADVPLLDAADEARALVAVLLAGQQVRS